MALGSKKSVHEAAGQSAVTKIEHHAKRVIESVKAGKCTSALINYAEMHNQVGVAEAHMRAANSGKVYIPTATIQEASGAFSDSCVRLEPATLTGARKARRR